MTALLPAHRTYAEQLDAADPLARFRDRLVIADESLIYLDGNSLGPLPRATAARIAGRRLVRIFALVLIGL